MKQNREETGQRRGDARSERGEHELENLWSSVRPVGGGWQRQNQTKPSKQKKKPATVRQPFSKGPWDHTSHLSLLRGLFHTDSGLPTLGEAPGHGGANAALAPGPACMETGSSASSFLKRLLLEPSATMGEVQYSAGERRSGEGPWKGGALKQHGEGQSSQASVFRGIQPRSPSDCHSLRDPR